MESYHDCFIQSNPAAKKNIKAKTAALKSKAMFDLLACKSTPLYMNIILALNANID